MSCKLVVAANVDALALTENPATIVFDVNVGAGVDALTLSENRATVNAEKNVQAITVNLVLAAQQSSIVFDRNVQAAVDALALTATSILVALGWPARTEHAAKRARSNSLRSYGIGFFVIFSPILIIGVGALIVGLAPAAASLPLLAILVPVAVVMAGLVMAFSLVAGAPSVLMLGRLLRANLGTYGAIVAGSAVVSLVWFLPVVGWLVPLTVLPLGAGSWIVASRSTPD